MSCLRKGDELLVANVGDSRCVMGRMEGNEMKAVNCNVGCFDPADTVRSSGNVSASSTTVWEESTSKSPARGHEQPRPTCSNI